MEINTEFQPYINKDLNQPRTCIWITPKNIEEYQLLAKLNESITNSEEVITGFTGVSKDVLLIQIPLLLNNKL